MGGTVKKTISLADLAKEAKGIACAMRLKGELQTMQGYWSNKAKVKGVLTKNDMERLLNR